VHEVLEARVWAQTIHPEVGPQEVRNIGGSFLVRFFEELKRFVVLTQTRIYDRNHIWRNVGDFRLLLQLAKYLGRWNVMGSHWD
jgi:hypothetical protein